MRSPRWAGAVDCFFLFALNAFICRELFRTEYTVHLGSIEAAYVAIARWVLENWRDLSWFPLWYTGIPFQNTYPPLLHLTVALAAALSGASPALAHHAVTAAMYCLGPLSLYWLARRLEADRLSALLAGLIYSLVSTSALLLSPVAADMGSRWYARRLHALVHYGEGPHVSSLALLPVAIALLAIALQKRTAWAYLLSALALAAVVLTNWLGAAALAAAAVAWLAGSGANKNTWLRAAGVALLAYALASPWIPPSTLAAIRMNAQRVGGDYRLGMVQLGYWAVLVCVFLAAVITLRLARASQLVRFAALFFLLMGGVTLLAEWFRLYLLPQPHRYHLEMEMALALLLAAVLRRLLKARRRLASWGLAALLLIGFAVQLRHYRCFARRLLEPTRMDRTIEYRMARWFSENMGQRRVMAPGSISFWMNAFTDTPQLGGGFEQGITNPQIPAAIFQIYSGMKAGRREGEIAVLWLKALGVHAVAVGGRQSREYYKPYANPAKFQGLLTELWREGDDVIYAVPQRSASLARVVPRQVVLRQPLVTAVDVEPMQPFVAALDDASLPEARWRWRNGHEVEIQAQLRPEHVLSIAISYHPGWQARVNGHAVPLAPDGLGLMVVEPRCEGPCFIELLYTGGGEMLAARLTSLAALLGMVFWILWQRCKQR